MKRVVAVMLSGYLLLGSLIPGNSFFEFSSMASLFKHYQFHRSTAQDIGFIAFLKLHYSNSGHQQSDPKNHSHLPLQHQGNTPPADEIVNLINPNPFKAVTQFVFSFSFPISSHFPDHQFSSGIFHPPSVLS